MKIMEFENIDDEMEAVREQCRKVRLARMHRKQLVRPSIPVNLPHLEDDDEEEKVVEDIRDACHELALKRGPTLQQQMVAPPYKSVEEKVRAISKVYTYNVTEAQLAKRKEKRATGRRVSFSEPLATYKEYDVVTVEELYHDLNDEEAQ